MANDFAAGVVDYSDDPILPAWYVPGWTAQNMETTQFSVPAPPRFQGFGSLPSGLEYVSVTGTYSDANDNQIGGYLTFEQSNDLVVTDGNGTLYRVPKRLVGNIPTVNTLAYNSEGSGRVYIQWGMLNVILLANDNTEVTIMTDCPEETPPDQWTYHVKEYFYRGYEYDIFVPTSTAALDINTLVVPGTQRLNPDWNRGF